jgi:hypothetical protein
MEKLGPILWNNIHTRASQCKTIEDKQRCIDYLHYLQQNFPCNRCKPHFGQYLKTNRPSPHIDLFLWSVDFHNAVNKRLGKPSVDPIDACNRYNYRSNMLC